MCGSGSGSLVKSSEGVKMEVKSQQRGCGDGERVSNVVVGFGWFSSKVRKLFEIKTQGDEGEAHDILTMSTCTHTHTVY